MLTTPVCFLIYNRPDLTAQVFAKIREARPQQLFVAADGPCSAIKNDSEKCRLAREVAMKVNWKCDVKTLFHDKNLGVRLAPSKALDWFFENVEQGIILEDDCLPCGSFFSFCHDLLNYYKDDHRISMISGNNHLNVGQRCDYSYYFSRYTLTWGWATWRRAWKQYDLNMKSWPDFKKSGWLDSVFSSRHERRHWHRIFETQFSKPEILGAWDYSWFYSSLSHGQLSICPATNLVSNIGFGPDSTHCKNNTHHLNSVPTEDITTIKHPLFMILSAKTDYIIFDKTYNLSKLVRLKYRALRALSSYP